MTSTVGDVVERWAVTLAERTRSAEAPVAAAVAREFARGGAARRRLLKGGGEQTGGFGPSEVGADFAHLLNALVAAGREIVALLDHQALGNVAGVGSLLLALRQEYGRRRRPDADPEVSRLIDAAVARLGAELQANGHQAETTLDLLTTLAAEPVSAREFLVALGSSRALPALPAPPWVWVFLISVLGLALPQWWTGYRDKIHEYDALPAGPIFGTVLLKVFLVASSLPILFLVAGVAGVAAPGLRCRWVEWRNGIGPAGPHLAEIQGFVSRSAPRVLVRGSVHTGALARIYPAGLRRARIVVFVPFLDLWAHDRPAAEAVLLHEIAHYRQGEHLVVGLGSPFSALLRTWGLAYLVLTVVPVAWVAMLGNPLTPSLAAQMLIDAAGPVRLLILPISALWLAEITADAWAAEVVGRAAVGRALGTAAPSFWRLLDHPPSFVRRWLVAAPGRPLLLTGWVAALLVRLAITVVVAAPAYLLNGLPVAQLPHALARGVGIFLDDSLPISLAVLALLALWPALSRVWSRPWDGTAANIKPLPVRPYLVAAVGPAVLVLAGIAAALLIGTP